MKNIQRLFFILLTICVVALGYFLYKDYGKKWFAKKEVKTPKTIDDVEFTEDHKIHIVIDAGHGGPDVGAIGVLKNKSKIYEKNITRKMVDAFLTMVDTSKYTVIESRPLDSNIHRHSRVKLATKFRTDLFLSFHCNSFSNKSWNGTEVHICDSSLNLTDTFSRANPYSAVNTGIADTLLKNVAAAFPNLKSNKVVHRKDRIWVIYAGNYPSVLLEWAYISNKKDVEIMNDSSAKYTLAKAVWKTVDEHFKIKK